MQFLLSISGRRLAAQNKPLTNTFEKEKDDGTKCDTRDFQEEIRMEDMPLQATMDPIE